MMRPLLWLLLLLVILQCVFITLGQDEEDDSDFAILDELEEMESCDGSCKAPGRDKVKKEKKPKQRNQQQPPPKMTAQQKQQEIQQMMAQYQHYLQYMEENGKGEEPLSPQEFMDYMNYMKEGQAAGLTPEEIQEKYAKDQQQKAMQSPEVQQELKDNLPDFSTKYSDAAYLSLKEVPKDALPPKADGCGIVKIPKGTFYMGSEQDENYEEDGEAPYRKIKISKPFYMDACEVTNGQFLQFWNATKMKGIVYIYRSYTMMVVFFLFVRQDRGREIWLVICI